MRFPASRLLTLSFSVLFTTFVVVAVGNHKHATLVKRAIKPIEPRYLPSVEDKHRTTRSEPSNKKKHKGKKKPYSWSDGLFKDKDDLVNAWFGKVHGPAQLVEVSPHDIRVLQGFVEGYNLQSIFMKACVAYSDRHFLPSRRHRWVTNEVDKEKFFPNGFLKASEFTKALCTVGSLPEFKPEKYWLLYIRASDVVWTQKWEDEQEKPPDQQELDFTQITWLNAFPKNAATAFTHATGGRVIMKPIGDPVTTYDALMELATEHVKGKSHIDKVRRSEETELEASDFI